jgi:glucose-1-phosphate adenylyltransferase
MSRIVAMILAGGRVGELSVLTQKRPKSAVPFGGIYRIIDFALSNLMRSGIDQIGILSQYRPTSLMDHVGIGHSWGLSGRRRAVRFLPPYQAEGDAGWYIGTSDALYQNRHYIRQHAPEFVLVLSGDHIYSMDYGPMIRMHLEKGADCTIALVRVPMNMAYKYGIVEIDGDNRILSYEEKPQAPRSNLASMTIYLFKTELLIKKLEENAKRPDQSYQIYKDILPNLARENKLYAYIHDGYWGYARTLDAFFDANMQLLNYPSLIDLKDMPVRTNLVQTRPGDIPAAYFEHGSKAENSIISSGARIAGTVRNSILSPYVVVESGALVEDSIIMHNAVIRRDAHIKRVILDKGCIVGDGAKIGIGNGSVPNSSIPDSLSSGITVVGKEVVFPADIQIGTNCIIAPDLTPGHFTAARIDDGVTVRQGGLS